MLWRIRKYQEEDKSLSWCYTFYQRYLLILRWCHKNMTNVSKTFSTVIKSFFQSFFFPHYFLIIHLPSAYKFNYDVSAPSTSLLSAWYLFLFACWCAFIHIVSSFCVFKCIQTSRYLQLQFRLTFCRCFWIFCLFCFVFMQNKTVFTLFPLSLLSSFN